MLNKIVEQLAFLTDSQRKDLEKDLLTVLRSYEALARFNKNITKQFTTN